MMQILATGWWCRKCEAFETEDYIDTTVDVCGCGCNGSEHVAVEVVSKTWEYNEVALPEVEVDERELRESLNRMEREA